MLVLHGIQKRPFIEQLATKYTTLVRCFAAGLLLCCVQTKLLLANQTKMAHIRPCQRGWIVAQQDAPATEYSTARSARVCNEGIEHVPIPPQGQGQPGHHKVMAHPITKHQQTALSAQDPRELVQVVHAVVYLCLWEVWGKEVRPRTEDDEYTEMHSFTAHRKHRETHYWNVDWLR